MKRLSTLKVLIADPDRQQYSIFQALFRGLNIPLVQLVEDSRILLDHMEEEAYDLVMIDSKLQPASAVEMVHYLRRDEESPNRYIPIIVMFSKPDIRSVIAARDAGANEFLVRPLTQDAVRKKLREVLVRPRPFVRSATYFGPDRRRKNKLPKGMKDRRAQEADIISL